MLRSTVLELPQSPRWDPKGNARTRVNPQTGKRERVPVNDPLTDEQKARALQWGEELHAQVTRQLDKIRARFPDEAALEDPTPATQKKALNAIEKAEREVQAAAIMYSEAVELRDELIQQALTTMPRKTATQMTQQVSERIWLSESRVRQIRAREVIADPSKKSHREKITETLTESFLRKEYEQKQRPMAEIAKNAGVDAQTVRRYMDRFGIEVRDPSEAQKAAKRGAKKGRSRSR